MIARPKISRNEWKTTERGTFEVGNVALFSCPGAYLFSTCFESDVHVEELIEAEEDEDVEADLVDHLAELRRLGITGPNVRHYDGAIAGGCTFVERANMHKKNIEGYLIGKAAASKTLKGLFLHVRVATCATPTEAYCVEIALGAGLKMGGNGYSWNKGHMGASRYGFGKDRGPSMGLFALCLLISLGKGPLSGKDGVAFLHLRDVELARELESYLDLDFWGRIEKGAAPGMTIETARASSRRLLQLCLSIFLAISSTNFADPTSERRTCRARARCPQFRLFAISTMAGAPDSVALLLFFVFWRAPAP